MKWEQAREKNQGPLGLMDKQERNRVDRQANAGMNQRALLRAIKQIILEYCDEQLIALYCIGSFLSHDMIRSSDIDLVGVMKPSFDFGKEHEINMALNRRIRSSHKIDLGTMSYAEFFGGRQQGSLMRHIELPILLKFLMHAHLIYGKRIDFHKLPVKPASPEEELSYHIKVFDKYKADFRESDRIGSDFSFRDFLKIIFYITNLELQLTKGSTPKVRYTEIDRALRTNTEHIVHYSMKLRRKRTITRKEKQTWLDSAEAYVTKIRHLASGRHARTHPSERLRLVHHNFHDSIHNPIS